MSKKEKDPVLPKHSEPQPGASVLLRGNDDGDVTLSFSDGSESLTMNRRDFMRVSGAAAATAAMSSVACREPVREIVPYVDRPEEVRIGTTNEYASVCNACPSQCGLLVKTRAGRPFKLEGNPKHPVSQGALCGRGQASYMDLYDPDRLRHPVRGDGSQLQWDDLDAALSEQVQQLRNGASLRILTGSMTGPASQALIDDIVGNLPDARHVVYEPLSDAALTAASEAGYGEAQIPHYRFDRADYILSLGSDFLGTWLSPVEFTKQFSGNRDPDAETMNRFVTFESNLTLTGINADDRFRVRPDQLVYVALGIAHELFENHGPAGVPSGAAQSALQPFDVESVADRLGDDVTADTLRAIAAELSEHSGRSIVIAGGAASATEDGLALESAVNLLNAALQNDGATIDRGRPSHQRPFDHGGLQALIEEIENDDVDVLIVDGVNPGYSLPGDLDFASLADNIGFVVSTATKLDETAQHADIVAAGCHYLEAWGDSSPRDGLYAIQQPAILPLYRTRSFEDSLLTWFGDEEQSPELAQFLEPAPPPAGNQPGDKKPYDPGPFFRYLQAHWEDQIYGNADTLASFHQFWETTMRDGHFTDAGANNNDQPDLRTAATLNLLPSQLPDEVSVDHGDLDGKVLHLFASIPMYDGRQANNGHLQELPDPISKHTWGSYAMVGYRTAQAANLATGQVLEVEANNGTVLRFPVIIAPGMHEDVIAIPLGYGRTGAGTVGDEVGQNAFELAHVAEHGVHYSNLSATIRRTGEVQDMSVIKGAGVIDEEQHRILATATLDEYQQDPSANVYRTPVDASLWEDHDFGDLKWGMTIDMTKCTGCSACTIACQEENNIPVVGRQGILEGREMYWMRIDRYYKLPEDAVEAREGLLGDPMYEDEPLVAFGEYLDKPRVVMQPMLCQHCDKAPCESVCPVVATMQSNDGLNQMAYNRCVGTRYCANNCPYKVRRFNWFNYGENREDSFFARLYPELKEHGRLNQEEPLNLAFNPDVTVRARGVMEKCTFCVQRIRRGKWEIMKEGRRRFKDGEVVTACQQSCPADAITFGNMVDDEHEVAQQHAEDRAMYALDDLLTKPAVAYLTSVWNTDEESA